MGHIRVYPAFCPVTAGFAPTSLQSFRGKKWFASLVITFISPHVDVKTGVDTMSLIVNIKATICNTCQHETQIKPTLLHSAPPSPLALLHFATVCYALPCSTQPSGHELLSSYNKKGYCKAYE